jgi:hypothetical protein
MFGTISQITPKDFERTNSIAVTYVHSPLRADLPWANIQDLVLEQHAFK